jgi:signal transduction histidine kinase
VNFNLQLSLTRQDLEKILHFLPYPFLVSDLINGVRCNIFVNKKFTEEIGYTCHDIPTIDDWFRVAYPDEVYRSKIINGWEQQAKYAAANGLDYAILRAEIQTRNHGKVWYEVKASVSEQNHLVVFINIDDIVRKEEILKAQHENKNRILSILSHDLRSPLSNLFSLTELAEDKRISSKEFLSTITTINRKTAMALELLDTTLAWTRTNFDNIQVRREIVKLEEVFENILKFYESALKEKNIKISFSDLDGNVIETDREIFTIIVRNVLSNAIKFTPAGGTIDVAFIHNGSGKTIAVTDSGIGMSQEVINSIRAGSIVSRDGTLNEKGVGIGLRFSLELAEKISSSVHFKSSPNGTVVSISFKNS